MEECPEGNNGQNAQEYAVNLPVSDFSNEVWTIVNYFSPPPALSNGRESAGRRNIGDCCLKQWLHEFFMVSLIMETIAVILYPSLKNK